MPQLRVVESPARLVAAGGELLLRKVKGGVNWRMRGVAIGEIFACVAGVRGYICCRVACADAGFAGGLRGAGMCGIGGYFAPDDAGVGEGRLELAQLCFAPIGTS